jgi:hypothetical protein
MTRRGLLVALFIGPLGALKARSTLIAKRANSVASGSAGIYISGVNVGGGPVYIKDCKIEDCEFVAL